MRVSVVILRLFKYLPYYRRIFLSKVVYDSPFFAGWFKEHPIKLTVVERPMLCQLGAAGLGEVHYCQSTFSLFVCLIG